MKLTTLMMGACALALSTFAFTSTALAGTVTVTNLTSQGWTSPAGEASGGGHAAITNTASQDGNGSVEFGGDRVRVELNNMYASPTADNNLGTLSSFSTDFSMQYMIATDSVTNLASMASPALRLDAWDNNHKFEFVYEQNYQPGVFTGVNPVGQWNTTNPLGDFYLIEDGHLVGSENTNDTLSNYISHGTISGNAQVTSINFGDGSGAGTGVHMFADHVTGGGTTWDFATSGAVPEPASWALMIMGIGGVGAALRSKRRDKPIGGLTTVA